MKRKTILFFAVCVAALMLSSCRLEVEREAVDSRYTPAYDKPLPEYSYLTDSWDGEQFEIAPGVLVIRYPEKYELEYIITYDNGLTDRVWETVTPDEYAEYINSRAEKVR